MKLLCILLLCLFWTDAISQNTKLIKIENNWTFAKEGSIAFLPATVPGYVHSALISNKIIDSLYWGMNLEKYNYLGDTGWVYKTTIKLTKEQISYYNKTLIFEGIDTYADVYFNDSLILTTSNMFLAYQANVGLLLKEGNNTLLVHLKSPVKEAKKAYAKYDYYSNSQAKADDKNYMKFARKAQYQFGWDFARQLITTGLYRPVYLKLWNNTCINDLYIKQEELNSRIARISANIEIEANRSTSVDVQILVNNKLVKAKSTLQLHSGINQISIPFEIENPTLWWPTGSGSQYLYNISARIVEGKTQTNILNKRIGLRTIEFVNNYDKWGKSYYFKVNGVPIFMKGASYVPLDMMLPTVSEEKYKTMIENCVDANMNMLRIWGGGIYENDIFYDLCDEAGILIYHDFMFASRMPPCDTTFLFNLENEAIYQVKRLRNHPCMALWTGSNEVESAYFEGYMPKEYPKEVYENDFKKIFETLLPKVVKRYEPDISYVRSSPTTGADSIKVNKPGYGDTHAWTIWFAARDFDTKDRLSRFISEYGFVGYPAYTSMKKYLPESEMDTSSIVFKFHDAQNSGTQENIRSFIPRYYPQPRNMMEYTYISGIMQAEAMKISTELYRRNMPFCMGALLWQLNDLWPVTSWSLIDYYGQWKPVMYRLRESFAPVLISMEDLNDSIFVYCVSDEFNDRNVSLNLTTQDFSGKPISEINKTVLVKANSSVCVFKESSQKFTQGGDKQYLVIEASLNQNGFSIANNLYYFKRQKDLKLPIANVQYSFINENGNICIQISTDKLVKNLYLIDSKGEIHFSNNYFDLLAGRSVKVYLNKNITVEELKKRFSIFSLNEI